MPPRLPKGIPGKSKQVWAMLDMPGHTKPKVAVSHVTFFGGISTCKKLTRIMHYFQRY